MKKLVAFFIERSLLVNLLSVGLILAGIIYMFSANREAFPKIEYPWVIIRTAYPGASASDIEKHITIPIEDELREVEYIEEIYSTSIESMSIVSIQLDPDVENKDKIVNDIRNAVDMVSDFPDDAEDPFVEELGTNLVPVIQFSVVPKNKIDSDEKERDLRAKAKILEENLRDLSGVSKIDKQGWRDREMIVEVDPLRLDLYHIGLNEIIGALSKKNLNFPGGLIQSGNEDLMIRTIGEVENAKEIEKVLIRANDEGYWVSVGDVAKVKDSFEEATELNKTDGMKSISLTVLKKESADIIDLVKNLEIVVKKFQKQYGNEYVVKKSNDMSFFVNRRLNVLINNGIVGLALVFISLLLTLGWRISLMTALGIPIAFAGTFVWMGQYDVTINLLSMFGLILVLGMLVDDAIIVAENIYRHLEEGLPPKEAVIKGTSEVITPVMGTILTTIAAFAPLMFMTGIMGKFMWTLPAVVSVSLACSWLESMFILPSHVYDIEKVRKVSVHKSQQEGRMFIRIKKYYEDKLTFVLHHKYLFSFLIFILFFGTMVLAGIKLKIELFPAGKIEQIIIKIENKTGINLEAMNKKIAIIEKDVEAIPKYELDNYITTVGLLKEAAMDPKARMGSNYATIKINLTPEEDRKRLAVDIISELRDKSKKYEKQFEKLEFKTIQTGPPQSTDISLSIKGDDFNELLEVADKYIKYLNSYEKEGIKDVKHNFEEGKKELQIFVDEKKAAIAGISVYDIASTIRTCFKGSVQTKIKKTDEEIDIRVIFPEKLRNDVKSLKYIKIANRMGNLVPLTEVTFTKNSRGISSINRMSWKRAIYVTGDIDDNSKLDAVKVERMLKKKFANLNEKYPGVIVDFMGAFKENRESMENLGNSFLIALLVIYIILVALFRSLTYPLIVVSIIPLTFIGVIWTFFIAGEPLSFLAMMGVVGLAGVIVNDSIVMVDFIRKERVKGFEPMEATIRAAGNRLRPIYLTTITTFLGLIPTAYGIGGNDPFLVPMALSMSWGLAFGTFITLFATPILYNFLIDLRRIVFKKERTAEDFAEKKTYYETEYEEEIKHKIEEDLKAQLKDEIEEEVIKDIEKKSKKTKQKKATRKKTTKKTIIK